MPMEGQSDAAVRAISRFTAITAEERSGKAAPIQKQNRLLALFEPSRNRLRQFFGKNRRDFFFSPLQSKIDNPDERHLLVVHALGQRQELVFARGRVVITLQRRRGAA